MTAVTITTDPRRKTYNPVVPTTDFPGGAFWPIAAAADVDVYLDGVKQVSGFSIIGTFPRGEENSLSTDWIVRFVSGISGQQIDIVGNRNPRRTVVYQEGVGVPARDQNTAFNTLTIVLRELYDQLASQIKQNLFGNYDAQNHKIINLAPGTDGTDAVNLDQLQAAEVIAGNVPAPGAPNVGKWLKALTATTFGWTSITVADVSGAQASSPALTTVQASALSLHGSI